MLKISELKKYYPELRGFDRGILREYLQYKILDIIFKSDFGKKLSFLGGTCIRICYDGFRFSEDLDFDNIGLSKDDFSQMANLIERELNFVGYNVEIRAVYKGAYRIYIKFSDILFDNFLSGAKEEKMMIQVDAVKKSFSYNSNNVLLSKFDVFRNIIITPIDVILSQKIGAIFGRKRAKGRDFYDVVYLMGLSDFNFNFLKDKLNISNKKELKQQLLEVTADFDFKKLAQDVAPFLINPDEAERVLSFKEYVEQKL